MAEFLKHVNARLTPFIAAVLFFLFLFPIHGYGFSLTFLADNANTVVIGTPRTKSIYWQNGIIKTRAVLDIYQVVRGEKTTREISIVYDGGVIGFTGLRVSHGVKLPIGQKTLVFLKSASGSLTVVNGEYGVFFLTPSKEGERAVNSSEFSSGGLSIGPALNSAAGNRGMSLKTLLQFIEAHPVRK